MIIGDGMRIRDIRIAARPMTAVAMRITIGITAGVPFTMTIIGETTGMTQIDIGIVTIKKNGEQTLVKAGQTVSLFSNRLQVAPTQDNEQFSDLSVPQFNLYNDIKEKLIKGDIRCRREQETFVFASE